MEENFKHVHFFYVYLPIYTDVFFLINAIHVRSTFFQYDFKIDVQNCMWGFKGVGVIMMHATKQYLLISNNHCCFIVLINHELFSTGSCLNKRGQGI